MSNKRDLNLSGSGSVGGGDYNSVKINGSAKVLGNISCENLDINGSGKLNGTVKSTSIGVSGHSTFMQNTESASINISGHSKFNDGLSSGKFTVSGTTKVAKDLKVQNLNVSGTLTVDGGISGENIRVSGTISSGKDLECESFNCRGSFSVNGLLNAENIDILSYFGSKAKEIGGNSIRIVRDDLNVFSSIVGALLLKNKRITAEIIEGSDIFLEYCEVNIVRGNNIVIGKGCKIKNIEYTNSLETLDDAIVENSTKIS